MKARPSAAQDFTPRFAFLAGRAATEAQGRQDGVGAEFQRAMFQFQGGISDEDNERRFDYPVKKKYLAFGENGRITYPEA